MKGIVANVTTAHFSICVDSNLNVESQNLKVCKFIRSILEQEVGTVYKRGSKINVALIYPNSYYVGMSNLGFHTIYHE